MIHTGNLKNISSHWKIHSRVNKNVHMCAYMKVIISVISGGVVIVQIFLAIKYPAWIEVGPFKHRFLHSSIPCFQKWLRWLSSVESALKINIKMVHRTPNSGMHSLKEKWSIRWSRRWIKTWISFSRKNLKYLVFSIQEPFKPRRKAFSLLLKYPISSPVIVYYFLFVSHNRNTLSAPSNEIFTEDLLTSANCMFIVRRQKWCSMLFFTPHFYSITLFSPFWYFTVHIHHTKKNRCYLEDSGFKINKKYARAFNAWRRVVRQVHGGSLTYSKVIKTYTFWNEHDHLPCNKRPKYNW